MERRHGDIDATKLHWAHSTSPGKRERGRTMVSQFNVYGTDLYITHSGCAPSQPRSQAGLCAYIIILDCLCILVQLRA